MDTMNIALLTEMVTKIGVEAGQSGNDLENPRYESWMNS